MQRTAPIWALTLLSLATVTAPSGCAIQTTIDSKIYRIEGPEGPNYYRVRIESSGVLAKSSYLTGLFPSFAVDAFLGHDSTLPTEILEIENDLRTALAEAQLQAFHDYLHSLSEDQEIAQKAARRLRQLQLLPVPIDGSDGYSSQGYALLQFNPLDTLRDYAANKKYVIALSADPDAILEQVAGFAEEAKTVEAVANAFVSKRTQEHIAQYLSLKPLLVELGTHLEHLGTETPDNQSIDLSRLRAIIQDAKTAVEATR